MSWKHDYLERAQHLVSSGADWTCPDWEELEDAIQGKLAIWQAEALFEFVSEIPGQASDIILSMMPLDIGPSE